MDISFVSVFLHPFPFDTLLLLLYDGCDYYFSVAFVRLFFTSKEFSGPSPTVVGRVGSRLCAALVRKLGMIPVPRLQHCTF